MSRVQQAMAAIDRRLFLPRKVRPLADDDRPLPIGYGVTNSQPWTVRYMLERLDVRPGDKVLDVGSGSGWTTALLGHLTGPAGTVLGMEIIPQLVVMGTANLASVGQHWVRIVQARDGVLGAADQGPFDRILVSATATELPESLVQQLALGGRMVLPIGHDMFVVNRNESGTVTAQATGDLFSFVPLIG